ncbi:MAG TPA: hypothetical protein VL426_06320 [Candidatus Binatia bacterium]|jgi:hypothetical protein|nr:hypothetical protein [Candidatus Binatia bacterium]
MTSNAILQRQSWEITVGREAAATVAETVALIAAAPFTPRAPVGGAKRILEHALDTLAVPHAGIVTASVSDPEPFFAGMSKEARRFIELRPHDMLARAISWRFGTPFDEELEARLGPLLQDAAGNERARSLRGRLWLELVRKPSKDGRNRDGELGMMIMQVRWAAASFLAGYAALGETAAVTPALRTVLELIKLGNAPLGRLVSGAFLMVTG